MTIAFADLAPYAMGTDMKDITKAHAKDCPDLRRNDTGGKTCQFKHEGTVYEFIAGPAMKLVAYEEWPAQLDKKRLDALKGEHAKGAHKMQSAAGQELMADILKYKLCPPKDFARFETPELYVGGCVTKTPFIKVYDRPFWDAELKRKADEKAATAKTFTVVDSMAYVKCFNPKARKHVGEAFEHADEPMGITLYACTEKGRTLFNAENLIALSDFAASNAALAKACKGAKQLKVTGLWPEYPEARALIDCDKLF
jgi:hypothetical protein